MTNVCVCVEKISRLLLYLSDLGLHSFISIQDTHIL